MPKIKIRTRTELPEDVYEWTDIEGTKVVIPDYEEFDFIFHRKYNHKGWFITEVSSGLGVYPSVEYCKTKAEAISMARQYLDKYVKAGVEISKGIKLYLNEFNHGRPVNVVKTKTKQRRLL